MRPPVGWVVLRPQKEEVRQLVMLGKADESEDQAELVYCAAPEEFPHLFPELEFYSSYYAEAFDRILAVLHGDTSLRISRPNSESG